MDETTYLDPICSSFVGFVMDFGWICGTEPPKGTTHGSSGNYHMSIICATVNNPGKPGGHGCFTGFRICVYHRGPIASPPRYYYPEY